MHIFNESFWLAICFVVFIYLAYRPVRNALLKTLDDKINAIKERVEEAEALKNESLILLRQAQEELAKLAEEKENILKRTQAALEELSKARRQELELTLARMQQEGENVIAAEKNKAYLKLKQEFSQIATKLAKEYFQQNQDQLDSDLEIAKRLLPEDLK